jgi:hypothetical protein
MTRGAPHARFQQLISDRLDGLLSEGESVELRSHLVLCLRCRAVERAYLRDRQQLRSLRPVPPPRDLWARTSTALDLELARQPRPSRRRPSRRRRAGAADPPALMLAAMGSLVLAVIVVGTQLGATEREPVEQDDPVQAVEPTPFEVATQALAFVAFTAEGLAIYETTVDRACPAAALDCDDVAPPTRRVVAVAPEASPADELDVDQANGRIALLTSDHRGRDTVSVVFVSGVAGPGTRPLPSDGPTGPRPSAPTSPVVPAGPSGKPSDAPPTRDPGTASPVAGEATAVAVETVVPTLDPERSAAPSATGATAVVQAVMADVQVVGAPPAWSSDGGILAFSAMPADRSRGPDVYVWRPGDDRPRRLSQDGSSYFASWSGSRLVASRAAVAGDGTVAVENVVIDPGSGAERSVVGDPGWLPVVSPGRRHAVAWRGELRRSGRTVTPVSGALHLVDWRGFDPFHQPESKGPGADEPSAPPAGASPSVAASDGVDADPAGATDAAAGHQVREADATLAATSRPAASAPADASAPPRSDAAPLDQPLDAGDIQVRDWRVRWADDGSAFGYWTSGTPGAEWGRLTVHYVARGRGIDASSPLLAATLARRSFSLGLERIVWVAPAEDRAEGELRLRTWGAGGYGGLRIRDIDVSSGLPAF